MHKLLFCIFISFITFLGSLKSETVDIFILAGQSNANGRGVITDLTAEQKTQEGMFFYSWHRWLNNATTISTQYYSGWQNQTVAGQTRSGNSSVNGGNYSETFGNSDWFGPELGFAARAKAINLTENKLGILKYVVDGSALITDPNTTYQVSDWDTTTNTDSDGDCWRGFQRALANAVTSLQNAGHTPNFRGMIWWQGENGTNATDLKVFIAAVRNHLATTHGVQNANDFPIVITGNDFWGAGLKTGVSDLDDDVGFIDSVTYGQIGGFTNTHIGSGENNQTLDATGNGVNDMYDIGLAYADEMATILDQGQTNPVTTYTITFINVDQTKTTQTVNEGVTPTPPTGVSTATKTFTAWPTINAATQDTSYTALYSENVTSGSNASLSISLSQSTHGTPGSSAIDLSAHGNLDWAAWDGGSGDPSQTMQDGNGFSSFTAIGGTSFSAGTFYTQNSYSWNNGTPTASKTTSLAGSASIASVDDGVRLSIQVSAAGTYQLKFYTTTYDLNLKATAALNTGNLTKETTGNYTSNSVERYEYTVDFTTTGADTLNLDFVKKDGNSTIFAQEAFSLKLVSLGTGTTTYQIQFINVDGTTTTQTVNEGDTPTPPTGVSTATKTFTAWPTISPATENTTYTAQYSENVGSGEIVDIFIATGQSNAYYPTDQGAENFNGFGRGVRDALASSNLFSNPTVVIDGAPGQPIAYWWAEFISPPGPNVTYRNQFFDATGATTGKLEALLNSIKASGNTARFRGLFWWQGESDGGTSGQEGQYTMRWNGFINQLNSDLDTAGVGSANYFFVMNTVAESGTLINETLTAIANNDEKGVIYDAVGSEYFDKDIVVEAEYGNLHDYDHYAVGKANAQLFINTFFLTNESPNINSGNTSEQLTLVEDSGTASIQIFAHDADQDSLSWSVMTSPSHGVVSLNSTANTTLASYTPSGNYNGSDQFAIKVTDNPGASDNILVNITVTNDDHQLTVLAGTGGNTSPTGTSSLDPNSSLEIIATPNEGYSFTNWSGETTGISSSNNATTTISISSDQTIQANFSISSYTITFDTNGGSEVSSITKNYGKTLSQPSDPTKEGYTFAGWDTTFPTTMPAQNTTLTATWTINSYTITFDANGGSEVSSITKNYGETLSQPSDPTKEGYTFAGWDTTFPTTMPAQNTTLTATWSINSYTITFDANGGSEVSSITKNYGETLTQPSDPTKDGYTFAGWDTTFPTTMPAQNTTLTATWSINSYTITFDANGGSEVSSITKNYGETLSQPSDPTRAGYTFSGWDTTFPTTMPAQNITITAQWVLPENAAPVIFQGHQYDITINEDDTSTTSSLLFTASDNEGDSLNWSFSIPPSYGAYEVLSNNIQATVTYTPNKNYFGTDSFVLTVTDSHGNKDSITISITIASINDKPVIHEGSLLSLTTDQNTTKTFTLTASDIEDTNLLWANSITPKNGSLSLYPAANVLEVHYFPNSSFSGSDNFTLDVHDSQGAKTSSFIQIYVNEIGNTAPVITEGDVVQITMSEDSSPISFDQTLTATDQNSDSLSWSLASEAQYGTASLISNGSTVQLNYLPNTNFNGKDNFSVIVTDGKGGSDQTQISITIDPVNDAPTAVSGNIFLRSGESVSITLEGDDIDGDTLSYSISQNPEKGKLSGTAPNLTYLPNPGATGKDSFYFIVNDGTASTEATLYNIDIAKEDTVLTIDQGNYTKVTMSEDGSPIPFFLKLSATSTSSQITWSVSNSASNGSVSVDSTGNVQYQPTENYHGSDSFIISVQDLNGLSESILVDLNIIFVNDAPQLSDSSFSVEENTSTPIEPNMLNYQDVDSNSLIHIKLLSLPSKGYLSLNGVSLNQNDIVSYTDLLNKKLLYFSAAGSGSFNLIYEAHDGSIYSNSATIKIHVNDQSKPVFIAPSTAKPLLSTSSVVFFFNEPVLNDNSLQSTMNKSNYSISGSAYSESPDFSLQGSGSGPYSITFSKPLLNGTLNIEVSGIEDLAGNKMDTVAFSLEIEGIQFISLPSIRAGAQQKLLLREGVTLISAKSSNSQLISIKDGWLEGVQAGTTILELMEENGSIVEMEIEVQPEVQNHIQQNLPDSVEKSSFFLLSLPTHAKTFKEIRDLLEIQLGPMGTENWVILNYTGLVDTPYNTPNDNDEVAPSASYWLATIGAKSLDFFANGPANTDLITKTLKPGWNLIGNPYSTTVSIDSFFVSQNDSLLSLNSSAQTVLNANLFKLNSNYTGYELTNALRAGEGAWIYNSSQTSQTLVISPNSSQLNKSSISRFSSTDIQPPSPPTLRLSSEKNSILISETISGVFSSQQTETATESQLTQSSEAATSPFAGGGGGGGGCFLD